jgi:hypothetical protein
MDRLPRDLSPRSGVEKRYGLPLPKLAPSTSDSSDPLLGPGQQERERRRSAPELKELERNRGELDAESEPLRPSSALPGVPALSLFTSEGSRQLLSPGRLEGESSLSTPDSSSGQLLDPRQLERGRPQSAPELGEQERDRGGLDAESEPPRSQSAQPGVPALSLFTSEGSRQLLDPGQLEGEPSLSTPDSSSDQFLDPRQRGRERRSSAPELMELGRNKGGLDAKSELPRPQSAQPGVPALSLFTSEGSHQLLDLGQLEGEQPESAPELEELERNRGGLHETDRGGPLEEMERFQARRAREVAERRERQKGLDEAILSINSQCEKLRAQLSLEEIKLQKLLEKEKEKHEDDTSVACSKIESECADLEDQISRKQQRNDELKQEREKQEKEIENNMIIALNDLQRDKGDLEVQQREKESELAALQKSQGDLEERRSKRETRLAALQKSQGDLEERRSKRETELSALQERKGVLEIERSKRKTELSALQERKGVLEIELSEKNKVLGDRGEKIRLEKWRISLLEKSEEFRRQLHKNDDDASLHEKIYTMNAFGMETSESIKNLQKILTTEKNNKTFENDKKMSWNVTIYFKDIKDMMGMYELNSEFNENFLGIKEEVKNIKIEEITSQDMYNVFYERRDELIIKHNEEDEETSKLRNVLMRDTGRNRREEARSLIRWSLKGVVTASRVVKLSPLLIEYNKAANSECRSQISLSGESDITEEINTRFKRNIIENKNLSERGEEMRRVAESDIARAESDIARAKKEISDINDEKMQNQLTKENIIGKNTKYLKEHKSIIIQIENITRNIENLKPNLEKAQDDYDAQKKSVAESVIKFNKKIKEIILMVKKIINIYNDIEKINKEIYNIMNNTRKTEKTISEIDRESEENDEKISELGKKQLKLKEELNNASSDQRQGNIIIIQVIEDQIVKVEKLLTQTEELLAKRDRLMAEEKKYGKEIRKALRSSFEGFKPVPRTTEVTSANMEKFKRITHEIDTTQAFIQKHVNVFEKLRYSISEFNEQYAIIDSFQKENNRNFPILENDDQEEILRNMESFRITSSKKQETLERFLSIDNHRKAEIKAKRTQSIQTLLEQLPEQCPTLADLPERLWWKLYIPAPDHARAEKNDDPGRLVDDDQSPGYRQGMLDLFEQVLLPIRGQQSMSDERPASIPWNYIEYTRMHRILTEHSHNKEQMRELSGIRITSGDYAESTSYNIKQSNDAIDLHEQIEALEEMERIYINDRPLFRSLPLTTALRLSDLPERPIVLGLVGHGYDDPAELLSIANVIKMKTLYQPRMGPQYVDTILTEYNRDLKTAGGDRYDIIRCIAKATNQLHTLHQKQDANGRTNIAFMNACLIREGLCPAIRSIKYSINLGGYKTIDGMVEEILIGMHSFIREAEQSTLSAQQK